MERIYLDTNASCPPWPKAVAKAASLLAFFGNPSSFHQEGRKLRTYLDEARLKVSKALGCLEKEVIFTSGASEANRYIVEALSLKAEGQKGPLLIYASPFEHPSVLKPLMDHAKRGRFVLKILALNPDCSFQIPKDLHEADGVFCCQAHNETGFLPDVECLSLRLGPKTILVSDASQGLSRIPPVLKRVDVVTASAHKMGGLAGAGALAIRGLARSLPTPWLGGGQERGLRPGTECVSLISAFGEACDEVSIAQECYRSVAKLRNALEEGIEKILPETRVLLKNQNRLPNTSAITFQNADKDALRIGLDQAGLGVGFGSACSGLAPEPSFSLMAMGLSQKEALATMRLSLSFHTTPKEIEIALERFSKFRGFS